MTVQLRRMAAEVDERVGNAQPPTLLSVSQFKGVVPRSELTDDEPRADSFTKYKVCAPGDLVLNRFNAYRGSLGVAGQRGMVSPDYLVLRPTRPGASRFLEFWLRSDWTSNEMLRSMGGLGAANPDESGFSRIDVRALLRLEVEVSDETSQRRIAEFLDRETAQIDELIAKQEQLISTLAERWQAELADVVAKSDVGGLRSKLKYHATIQTGLTLGKAVDGDSIELPYLRVANVQVGHVDLSEVKTVEVEPDAVGRHSLRAGDVLMTEGGDLDKLGRGALWDGSIEPCLHQNHVFAVRCRPTLHSRWLVYVLDAPDARKYFLKTAKKTTNLASTNSTVVGGLPIPCPPLQAQLALVQHLDGAKSRYDALTSNARAVIEALRERRQALISAAVTGQIDVGGAS